MRSLRPNAVEKSSKLRYAVAELLAADAVVAPLWTALCFVEGLTAQGSTRQGRR
jgi:hypothetical protein